MHRPIEGEVKTCTLRKNASGEWDVSFSCEVNVEPLAPKQEAIGIDVALNILQLCPTDKRLQTRGFSSTEKRRLQKHKENFKAEKRHAGEAKTRERSSQDS